MKAFVNCNLIFTLIACARIAVTETIYPVTDCPTCCTSWVIWFIWRKAVISWGISSREETICSKTARAVAPLTFCNLSIFCYRSLCTGRTKAVSSYVLVKYQLNHCCLDTLPWLHSWFYLEYMWLSFAVPYLCDIANPQKCKSSTCLTASP